MMTKQFFYTNSIIEAHKGQQAEILGSHIVCCLSNYAKLFHVDKTTLRDNLLSLEQCIIKSFKALAGAGNMEAKKKLFLIVGSIPTSCINIFWGGVNLLIRFVKADKLKASELPRRVTLNSLQRPSLVPVIKVVSNV